MAERDKVIREIRKIAEDDFKIGHKLTRNLDFTIMQYDLVHKFPDCPADEWPLTAEIRKMYEETYDRLSKRST